jgi:hypothetical protein
LCLLPADAPHTVFNCSLYLPLKVSESGGNFSFEFDHDNLYGMARGFYTLPDNHSLVWIGLLQVPIPEEKQVFAFRLLFVHTPDLAMMEMRMVVLFPSARVYHNIPLVDHVLMIDSVLWLQAEVRRDLYERFHMVPIFLEQKIIDEHYLYCKKVRLRFIYNFSCYFLVFTDSNRVHRCYGQASIPLPHLNLSLGTPIHRLLPFGLLINP